VSEIARKAAKQIRETAFPTHLMGNDFAPWFEDAAKPIIDAAIAEAIKARDEEMKGLINEAFKCVADSLGEIKPKAVGKEKVGES